VVSAYVSTDGNSWTAVHLPEAMTLPQTVELGIFLLRSGGTGMTTGSFSNLQVVEP
jgi:hypothetical protein